MKLKSNINIAVLSGILLTATVVPTVMAAQQKPDNPTKMTCEEFLTLDDSVQPGVVYWSEGYNKKAQADEVVFDIAATDELVPVIITECQKTPKASFWQKIKKYF